MAPMRTHILLIVLASTVALAFGAANPRSAAAAWCWPDCSSFGWLGPGTSTYNGCWYASGEVCSGWNTWSANGINKACAPICSNDWTGARVLYGFENNERIRGFYTLYAGVRYVYPYQLGMCCYLRAQASWATYSDGSPSYSSWIHVGAV
jgi:hypothetical protein